MKFLKDMLLIKKFINNFFYHNIYGQHLKMFESFVFEFLFLFKGKKIFDKALLDKKMLFFEILKENNSNIFSISQ